MTAIETAIRDAIRGGWRPPFILRRVELEVGFGELFYQMYAGVFLNPLFWQALGKARGWVSVKTVEIEYHFAGDWTEWEWNMHRFIDHLIAGKTAEDFFKSL